MGRFDYLSYRGIYGVVGFDWLTVWCEFTPILVKGNNLVLGDLIVTDEVANKLMLGRRRCQVCSRCVYSK